jgi:hypothetical protein
MTPDLLVRIGIALFGTEEWQLRLCKALQVSIRTVQRWAAGTQPMPESLAEDLIEILGAKRAAITTVLRDLIVLQRASAK